MPKLQSLFAFLPFLVVLITLSILYVRTNNQLRTDKKKLAAVQDELSEKENYVRTILMTEPECVKLLDENGCVLDINPAGVSLVEADNRNSLIGECIYELIDQEYLLEYRKLVKNVFAGFSQTLIFKMKSLQGHTKWMETHSVPMRTSAGKIIAALGITRDITAKVNAEEAARSHQEELMRVCRILSVGELASALAHELNQPLCAIISYSEILEREIEMSFPKYFMLHEYAKRLTRETERAGEIIQRLRQFVCKHEPKKSLFDINNLTNEVSEFMFSELKRFSVKYSFEISNVPCIVKGDYIQIQQVLINLITNSIDAMKGIDESKRELFLKIEPEACHGKNISILIQDNGLESMNIDYNRLFEPFYTTKSGGVGIGLSISRSIIESHGGNIKYTRIKNSGMKFIITLPRHQEENIRYEEKIREITTCVYS